MASLPTQADLVDLARTVVELFVVEFQFAPNQAISYWSLSAIWKQMGSPQGDLQLGLDHAAELGWLVPGKSASFIELTQAGHAQVATPPDPDALAKAVLEIIVHDCEGKPGAILPMMSVASEWDQRRLTRAHLLIAVDHAEAMGWIEPAGIISFLKLTQAGYAAA